MAPRLGWFGKLIEHFHTHPNGRLHEFLFWFGLGAGLGLFALWGWMAGWMSDAIALVLGVIALSFAGWSLLPQHKVAPKKPPAHPKSKRKR